MNRPRVIIHNLTSLDGRLGGFPADIGLYYEIAAQLPHQAVLTGSGTMLTAAASEGIDMTAEDPDPPAPQPQASPAGTGTAPLLVIVDSRGQLTRYAWLRQQPFWRDILVLCSAATPAAQLSRLRRHHVGYAVLGSDRVDLAAALRMLASQHRVSAVRVDAGPALNSTLLQAGLADEISVVIAPYLAATASGVPFLTADPDNPVAFALSLIQVERLRNGHIWLRYGSVLDE